MQRKHVKPIGAYPSVLGVKDLAEIFSVSTRTVYKMLQEEKLPSAKVGRERRVPKSAVLEYLEFGAVHLYGPQQKKKMKEDK